MQATVAGQDGHDLPEEAALDLLGLAASAAQVTGPPSGAGLGSVAVARAAADGGVDERFERGRPDVLDDEAPPEPLGALLGAVGFVATSAAFERDVGLVIGLTLLAVCTMAAAVGGVMPLVGRFVRVDPAVFSNPFITTFVDAAGLVVYFLVARAVLGI